MHWLQYSPPNSDNLTQPIQSQLSLRQKKVFSFFSAYLKFSLNFEDFQKEDDPHN